MKTARKFTITNLILLFININSLLIYYVVFQQNYTLMPMFMLNTIIWLKGSMTLLIRLNLDRS